MSHYIPSAEKYPIVYYVNLFYQFLIPGVLIPMGILVVMDFSRMMINRFRKKRTSKQHSVEKVKMHEKPEHPQMSELPAETAPASTTATSEEKPVEPGLSNEAPPAEQPQKPESPDEEAQHD
jgi:hypothetical protein